MERQRPPVQPKDMGPLLVDHMITGLTDMTAPEGSDIYVHGRKVYQMARLDAAVLGFNPNRLDDIARDIIDKRAHEDVDGFEYNPASQLP